MKKRLLALILCLVMVIGLVPTAFAGAATDPATDTNVIVIGLNNYPGEKNKQITIEDEGDPIYMYTVGLPEKTDPGMENPGYEFDGWYYDEAFKQCVNATDNLRDKAVYNRLDVYAKWTLTTPATQGKYKIILHPVIRIATLDTEIEATINTVYQLPNLSRDGYTFNGWEDADGEIIEDGSLMLREDEVPTSRKYHVYAVWEENTEPAESYKVIYHKTAVATSDTKNALPDADGRYTLVDYEKLGWTVPEGKQFICWVDNSKDNDVFTVGTTLKLNNKNLDLYPVFEDAETPAKHTVTFYCWNHDKTEKLKFDRGTTIVIDPNGGKFWYKESYTTDTKTFSLKADYKIENAKRTGYTFYGWKATEDARTNTVTFTAQWSKDYPTYRDYSVYYYDYDDGKYEYAYFDYNDTLIFDANGGSAKLNGTKFTGSKTVSVAQSYTLSDAERAGYTFYGWDLVEATGSKYYFTAMWARKTSTVPYMLNGSDHFAYIKGYPNGTIRPEATITRAEVATIFYRLLTDTVRKSYGTSYNTFKDVASNAWYNTAVSTMANLGIITGDTNGYFRPNDSITRAELAAMIARCDGGYYTGTGYYFSDTRGHWAADYIARAYDLGWINGYGDSYAPDRKITRAETMAVLNRVLDRAPQYTSDLLSGMNTFSDNLNTSAWYYLDVQEATNSHTYTRKTNDYEYWNKLVANPSWY